MTSNKLSVKVNWLLFVRLAFLGLSLIALFRIVDFPLVLRHLGDIPVYILGLLVVFAILHTWLSGVRWQLVNPDVTGQLTRWQYFRLMMASKPFNLIMPGALGGDFVKTALVVKMVKSNRVDNVLAVLVDHVVGLVSIVILGSTALLFMREIPEKIIFYRIFALLAVGFAVSVVAAANAWLLCVLESILARLGGLGKRLIHVLDTWRAAILFFKSNMHRLLLALLLCLPIHGLSFLTAYVLSVQLEMGLSFFDISLILALVWVITAIPISIAGLGVRELSLIYFLSLYGVGSEPATALSIYLYIVSVVMGGIGLVFLFIRPGSSTSKAHVLREV